MEHFIVKKSQLKGEIDIPSSKSQTLRAILFGAMGKGKTTIHDYLESADTEKMVSACRFFGAEIDFSPQKLEIQGVNGKIDFAQDLIDAGNSGINLRFCTAVGSLAKHPVVITGDESIKYQRPMKDLLEGLRQMGVKAFSLRGDDYAPIIVHGPLQGGKAILSGEDSQPVSALLIAASFSQGTTELSVQNPGEKPWVALTLEWLKKLGVDYENRDFKKFVLKGNSSYEGFEYRVPGDLSSAAFPIGAALVTGSEITLNNIDLSDFQGDKDLITIFRKMGAEIDYEEKKQKLHIKKTKTLTGLDVDINNFIDALPILSIVACFAESPTEIYNASNARHKECDRIACIVQELKKMGAHIKEKKDGLIIYPSKLKSASLNSYSDHRLAMSLTIAGLATEGETIISPVRAISKTFPHFCQKFQKLGAQIWEIF